MQLPLHLPFSALVALGLFATAHTASAQLPKLSQQDEDRPDETVVKKRPTATRDVMTHQKLAEAKPETTEAEFLSQFKPNEDDEPDASNAQVQRDIVRESDILSFGGIATLVPKSAVIRVPEKLKSRMTLENGAKIVTWVDFFAKNRAWITTLEVTYPEAAGEQPFAEERSKWIEDSSKVIVALHKGNPVSVRPAKTEEEEETEPVAANDR